MGFWADFHAWIQFWPILTHLWPNFAMDTNIFRSSQVYHVIEHHQINKSRGDYFFKKFLFFWNSAWDMLLGKKSPGIHFRYKIGYNLWVMNYPYDNFLEQGRMKTYANECNTVLCKLQSVPLGKNMVGTLTSWRFAVWT